MSLSLLSVAIATSVLRRPSQWDDDTFLHWKCRKKEAGDRIFSSANVLACLQSIVNFSFQSSSSILSKEIKSLVIARLRIFEG